MQELGKMWKECTEVEKYQKLATDAKKNYEEKIEDYNLNNYYE